MSIVRVQKNSNYSVISNVHLQDESLSWKAKGILSYLLSKPDNWQIYVAHLKNQSTDGRDATASGIRELINAGYITRDYSRNEAGQITGRDYVVHESALEKKAPEKPVNGAENPKTENPSTVKPTTVKPELLNTDNIKDGLKKNTDDVPPPDPATSPKSNTDSMQEKDSSSSFSESELISILAGLINLIPKQHQKPMVAETVRKALSTHSEDYVRTAILYSLAKSNGDTTQKFKSFLGQCIDKAWAVGWEPETVQGDTGPTIDFTKLPEKDLKNMIDTGNVLAIQEFERRKEQEK